MATISIQLTTKPPHLEIKSYGKQLLYCYNVVTIMLYCTGKMTGEIK